MAVPRSTYFILAGAVLAASQSANIIRIGGAAPAAVIAAWRLIIASAALAPFATRGLVSQVKGRREVGLLALTGLALALHLLTWIAGVQRTSVANASLLYSVHPVLTAAGGAIFFRERIGARLAVSILLSLVGVAILGIGDLELRPEGLVGDGLCMISAGFFATYLLLGRYLRRGISSLSYVLAIYAAAGVASTVIAVAGGAPMLGYDKSAWLCFVLMAAVPTLLGHTGFNHAVRYVEATQVSMAAMAEPLFAAVGAAILWNEPITGVAVGGYALIILAVVVLVYHGRGVVPGVATALAASGSTDTSPTD